MADMCRVLHLFTEKLSGFLLLTAFFPNFHFLFDNLPKNGTSKAEEPKLALLCAKKMYTRVKCTSLNGAIFKFNSH